MDTSRELRTLRDAIDGVNGALLELLNRRLELALQAVAAKEREGVAIHDPGRERAMIDALVRDNPGPLTEAELRRIYELLFDIVKRRAAG